MQIEEVGWEHLVRSSKDLTLLSFRVLDTLGRIHVLEVQLHKEYPEHPPSVSGDVPALPKLEWKATSKLKDALSQFRKHLDKLESFWSVLDDIDRSLCVSYPKLPCRAECSRGIDVGNDCCIMVCVRVEEPNSLPECRFIGSRDDTMRLGKGWMRNSKKWDKEKPFRENLETVLGFQLPKPLNEENNDLQAECGICYSHHLPVEDELGPSSGSGADFTCENASCRRAFHSICLIDWLRSITTTRQSFNVLFGKCPYCSEVIAVKLNKS
ncbi:hypothetical protein MLD38_028544 [Melastoma candidum]|uniref:Uncharacterized protein n=1 Tax=Melastoma candidum TaxID=119954 RepID=A0ACB9N782_9MYRT|nr:hypothetical protein MLD38_028544 [Melastoma candidum]